MRFWLTALCFAVLLTAVGPSAPYFPGRPYVCPGVRAPSLVSANVDPYTARLHAYARSGAGWSSGDATYSVRLRDRQLWLFADSSIGLAAGTQRVRSGVNNAGVLDDGRRFTTLIQGSMDAPRSLIPPPDDDHVYWVGGSAVHGDRVWVLLSLMRKRPSGLPEYVETRLTSLPADDLRRPAAPVPVPARSGIVWASWLRFASDGHAYVYGQRVDTVSWPASSAYLARVPVASLTRADRWSFWSGDGWSADEDSARPIGQGVNPQFSVAPYGRLWIMVTHHGANEVVAQFACAPTGPFTARTTLYRTEAGTRLDGMTGSLFTHNALEHPELRRGNRLLVTYNRNSDGPWDVFANAAIGRPTFLNVRLAP